MFFSKESKKSLNSEAHVRRMLICSCVDMTEMGAALTLLSPRLSCEPGIHGRRRERLPPLTTAWAGCLPWLLSCKSELETDSTVISLNDLHSAKTFRCFLWALVGQACVPRAWHLSALRRDAAVVTPQ